MYTRPIRVQVIGHIWQPGFDHCATTYTMPADQLDPDHQRASVRRWLDAHAGNFENLTDFCAILTDDSVLWWNDDLSEFIWHDCIYGEGG